MNEFRKYQHLERLGTDGVQGIDLGQCHIFPKIDGTNASVWNENGSMACGSRNRLLAIGDDNAGFLTWAREQDGLRMLIQDHPDYIFYGEWLVPHSLKTYRDESWRQFYIFDVYDRTIEKYLSYNIYSEILKRYNVAFIPCTLVATNPSYEQLQQAMYLNTFLLKEGTGSGEGIVIKRYDFINGFGHTVWAKLITNTFKEKHILEMGGAVTSTTLVEEQITQEVVTKHLVDKVVAKIRNDTGEFSAKQIPRLLQTVYYDVIHEELWDKIKEYKNPVIDFKKLQHFCFATTKQQLPELFGV